MIRPKEENGNFTGAFYIILGGLATIIFFPRYIAFTAITFEILGDVASAMIGRRYGKHFIRRPKTIEGALGFLVVALLVALLVILLVPKEVPFTVGIIGAIVATIVEAVSIHRDDNLTVPLISGLVMHLLVIAFPMLP
jgi:acyl phosphate:glycerol-3-phosphate acyltransferase